MPPSRRDELIDAAVRVFYRHGFHSSGLDMVLQEAGVSRMTLYNHFKSKDELIVAALRRRDENFRNRMMEFVEGAATDPVDRILAVFDYHEAWFAEKSFRGCMFINATAEFSDPRSPIRHEAAQHKREVLRYLRQLCDAARLPDPESIAEQLNLILEGAIVSAHVVGQVEGNKTAITNTARRAKEVARRLIEAATHNGRKRRRT